MTFHNLVIIIGGCYIYWQEEQGSIKAMIAKHPSDNL